MSEIELRYREVLRRVEASAARAGRAAGSITLIAVSKTQPLEAIERLYGLGHRDFGENYVQELVQKASQLRDRGCVDIRWHFIGHLQTNKVKLLLPHAHAIHSVDSERLALEIDKRWQALAKSHPIRVFLEVNIDREPSKTGSLPENTPALAARVAALASLRLEGLMCIPAALPERTAAGSGHERDPFGRLRELEVRCHPYTHGALSMGMTQDFEGAILEGATHVRVGTAIFGARK